MSGLHFDITGDNSNLLHKLEGARNGVRATSKQIEESGMSIEQMFGSMTKAAAAFGISLGANWKGFDLNILLQGVGKRDYWNGGVRRFPFAAGEFGTIFSDQLNYWKPTDPENDDYTPVNSNPKYFRIYNQRENASSNTRVQTRYLLDASYLRIKNVTLGYTIPQALVQKIGLSKVKLFTSIENLHTFDSLPSGYDPERLNWGYPFYRTISLGFNVTL